MDDSNRLEALSYFLKTKEHSSNRSRWGYRPDQEEEHLA